MAFQSFLEFHLLLCLGCSFSDLTKHWCFVLVFLARRVPILLLIRKVPQLLWSCYLFIRLIFLERLKIYCLSYIRFSFVNCSSFLFMAPSRIKMVSYCSRSLSTWAINFFQRLCAVSLLQHLMIHCILFFIQHIGHLLTECLLKYAYWQS